MASREEQEYSSQAPAGYIGSLLSGTIFPYAQSYFKDQFANLGREDSSPFTYTGDRVADFDPRELAAMQMSDAAIGSYRPYLDRSGQLFDRAALQTSASTGEFDPSRIDRFYNPFEEDVVQQTLTDIDRNYATQDKGLRDRAVSQGAFGGSRGRIAQEELARQTGRGAAEAVGKIRSGGFGQASQLASNAYEQAQRRGLQGAGQMAGIGSNFQGLGQLFPQLQSQDIQRTMGFGGLGRGRQQSLMDLAYQNFTGQYNLPMQLVQNLGSLTASLGPLAGGYGYAGADPTTQSSYQPRAVMGGLPNQGFLPYQQGPQGGTTMSTGGMQGGGLPSLGGGMMFAGGSPGFNFRGPSFGAGPTFGTGITGGMKPYGQIV